MVEGAGLTSIIIPDSVEIIESGAFYGCTALESITVDENNNNYASVDGVLFDKAMTTLICCPGGKKGSYKIPDGVENIGDEAFYHCAGLTSVTISDSVTNIGWAAFSNCTGLTSVVIPDGITLLDNYMFYECSGLKSITIPDSVTNIKFGAFYNCIGLTDVYYTGSENDWREIYTEGENTYLTGATRHYIGKISFSEEEKKVTVESTQAYTDTDVIITSFDENGEPIMMKIKASDIQQGSTDIAFEDFDVQGAKKIKVMIWESKSSLKPLFNAYYIYVK